MDLHVSRGFTALSGHEIKQAICGSLFRELSKNSDFDSNIAWAVVKWKVHVEVEYAANLHADLKSTASDVNEERLTRDEKGKILRSAEPSTFSGAVEHEVEYPDLVREKFIEPPQSAKSVQGSQPDNGNPPQESVGSTAELSPTTGAPVPKRTRGRPRIHPR